MTIAETGAPAPAGTYAAGRIIHDADAHMVEPDGFYEQYADPDIRDRLAELDNGSRGRVLDAEIRRILARAPQSGAARRRTARRDHPQEPRCSGVVRRTRPGGRPRQPRVPVPADLQQLVPQRVDDARPQRPARPVARRHHGAQPRRDRLLQRRPAVAPRVLGTLRLDRAGRRRRPRGARRRRGRPDDPVDVPARARPDARRPRPAVGDGRGGRHPDRLPRRRWSPDGPGVQAQRPARCARLPRR